ncbi:MAG: cytochrome c oxidase assembly protein [Hyphomicrobiales bacterium]|nr:cytochrome c oxidase assembly protein [Hyphomicrobiales bacterium]
MKPAPVIPNARKNLRVAAVAGTVVLGMVGLTYASVPLYSMFCKATGFGGTTQRADAAPETATGKFITIRFDANTAASLGWNFHPAQPVMKVRIGEQNLAHYSATNTSAKTLTGTASFNVTPAEAGAYFNKIECFCFTEQTLKPGETVDLPVDFFVDPAILDDPDSKSISEITLSYTFFPVDKPDAVSAVEQNPPKQNAN